MCSGNHSNAGKPHGGQVVAGNNIFFHNSTFVFVMLGHSQEPYGGGGQPGGQHLPTNNVFVVHVHQLYHPPSSSLVTMCLVYDVARYGSEQRGAVQRSTVRVV